MRRIQLLPGACDWPHKCACCGGKAETTVELVGRGLETEPKAGGIVYHTAKWTTQVPYCQACKKHTGFWTRSKTTPQCSTNRRAVSCLSASLYTIALGFTSDEFAADFLRLNPKATPIADGMLGVLAGFQVELQERVRKIQADEKLK